jgi:S1-C subfamily serine protease
MWVTIGSGEGRGVSVRVEGERFLVGSGDECQLMVGDPKVAPLHAYFEVTEDGRVLLHDLGSDEGTYVNGRKIDAPAHIEGGEAIRVGDTELVPAVRSPEEEAAERAASGADGESDDAPVRVRTDDGDLIEVVPEHDGDEGPHVRVRSEGEAVEIVPVGEHRRLRERITLATGLAAAAGLAAIAAVVVFLATRGEEPPSTSEIVADARARTVLIDARTADGQSGGSGFVLDADEGLVVTNFHVVNAAEELSVGLDGDVRDATLYSAAPCEDLALLKVEDTSGMKSFPLASQSDIAEGDRVVAVGYPANASLDTTLTTTEGVVSVAENSIRIKMPDMPTYSNVVQTDAAINPGNSGGPLINTKKRVIGVNTATLSKAGGAPIQGQGYAIGVDRLKEVLETLETGKSAGFAGFGVVFPGKASPTRGAAVAVPMEGLDGRPFLLSAVNGTPVNGTYTGYCDAVRSVESGQTAVLTVAPRPGAAERRLKMKFR